MKFVFFVLSFCLIYVIGFADNDNDDIVVGRNDSKNNFYTKINNNHFELFDSAEIWWLKRNRKTDSIFKNKIPVYPDEIYSSRIKDLNEYTPIKLEFNEHVKYFIDAYSVKNREKLLTIMEKSVYYFPIFEEILSRYQLPLELKYLAAVESALDPCAVSKSGAVGLWQFMKNTADILGLKVTSYVDERREVFKSTDAACRYLKYLYDTFEDWQLVLAAYNGGPGAVKKAIARGGGKTNYWEIREFMSDQMQRYVPAFIAITYLMNYSTEHALFPNKTFFPYSKTDTLNVFGPLYLKNIANTINVDYNLIKSLNPIYTYDYIPNDGSSYPLVLPFDKTNVFIENIENIKIQSKEISIDTVTPPFIKPVVRNKEIIYVAKPGDSLFRIAVNNNTTVSQILQWNNLPQDYILKVGDKIKIFVE